MGSGFKGPQLSPDGLIWIQVAWTNGFCWFRLWEHADLVWEVFWTKYYVRVSDSWEPE